MATQWQRHAMPRQCHGNAMAMMISMAVAMPWQRDGNATLVNAENNEQPQGDVLHAEGPERSKDDAGICGRPAERQVGNSKVRQGP